MRLRDEFHLRPLTVVLISIFVVVLGLALMPQLDRFTLAELRLGVISVSVVALVLSLFAIQRTTRRLERLAHMATAMEEGDYSVRVVENGTDSIAQLSRAVNQMAQRTQSVIADLRMRDEEIRLLATHDLLTALPNRRLFNELLVKELAHTRRSEQALGLVLFDLDNFKIFNDNLGTVRGDKLLQEAARRLRQVTREADTLARVGGDEFALIVARTSRAEEVLEAARRVAGVFEEPLRVGDREMRVSVSAGVSVCPDDSLEPDLMMSHAHAALRWAKKRGGNSIQMFEPNMERKSEERLALEQDFPRALASGQFSIWYQPLVALSDGRLVGLEALVRWQHPDRGSLQAGSFISTLEDSALMPRLGKWILGEICRQSKSWQRSGLMRLPVSVNVSVRQFQAGDLAESVAAALADHGIDSDLLQLELTESIAMHDLDRISEVLSRLNRLGVRIHLDDFGTGYSSLSYLTRFPVDVLKIDRSFVAGIPKSRQSTVIVRATIGLAQGLGLSVIAEGVETIAQLEFLRAEGCGMAQGYLFCRPKPAAEIEPIIKAGRIALPA